MNILGLIPARGGSKGIPGKNIVPLGGKPLIAWTIEAAKQSGCLSKIIVSTDAEDIADVAKKTGAEVPFLRPAEYATDTATGLDVMRHALKFFEASWPVDILVYLQPTSPFRRGEHIAAAVEALKGSDADGAVSVVKVPHNMLPECLMEIAADGSLKALSNSPLDRHSKRQLFARNGPAVLAVKADYLKRCQTLYEGNILPMMMPPALSLDIDTTEDLWLAQALASTVL